MSSRAKIKGSQSRFSVLNKRMKKKFSWPTLGPRDPGRPLKFARKLVLNPSHPQLTPTGLYPRAICTFCGQRILTSGVNHKKIWRSTAKVHDGSGRASCKIAYFAHDSTCFRMEIMHRWLRLRRPLRTSIEAELRAAIKVFVKKESIEAIAEGGTIVVMTESQYVVEGATKWAQGWVRNKWRNSCGRHVEHKRLWKTLLRRIDQCIVDKRIKVYFWRSLYHPTGACLGFATPESDLISRMC